MAAPAMTRSTTDVERGALLHRYVSSVSEVQLQADALIAALGDAPPVATAAAAAEGGKGGQLHAVTQRLADQVASVSPEDREQLLVWKLTEHDGVREALHKYVQSSRFGTETDPVCEWLYRWAQGAAQDCPLLRFVAWLVPQLLLAAIRGPRAATTSQPGLDAVLIAVHAAYPDYHAAATQALDLYQPSVFHVPSEQATRSAVQGLQGPSPGTTSLSGASKRPPAVEAVFSTSMRMQPKLEQHHLRSIPSCSRPQVYSAALYAYCTWLTTFLRPAVHREALQLCSTWALQGCPGLQQQLSKSAKQDAAELTSLTPNGGGKAGPAAPSRIPLTVEVVAPMCLALTRMHWLAQQHSRGPGGPAGPLGDIEGAVGTKGSVNSSTSGFQALLKGVAVAISALHLRCQYELLAEGLLMTSALQHLLHESDPSLWDPFPWDPTLWEGLLQLWRTAT